MLLAVLAAGRSACADEPLDFFEREVRPVLVEKCWRCHGADKQSSGLRLDSREAIQKGGEGGPVVVPGDPARSRMLSAIRHEDGLAMPPKEKLTDRQIAALTRWVELGTPWPVSTTNTKARWETHWAFQPLRKPAIPAVEHADWPQTPVDAFILARLEQSDLSPSPAADRRTLIRRASSDVLGLPPTPDEVAAFIHNPDPPAYEHLIERLLASPHYGEQWGRHWLDVARYSDTKGYVYAREERFWVHAWSYRDWVVRSLNEDLAYDRFLMLQIAADQVAPDDAGAQAALGFLTLGRRFLGVKHDIIDDRIDVVTRGTMGLTVGCARCHDHKYDPIPTRDYYSLYGVFQNCTERQTPIGSWSSVPEAVQRGFKERQWKLRDTLDGYRTATSVRVRGRIADYLIAQNELYKYPEEGFDQILEPSDVLPAFVRRWRDILARGHRDTDAIFGAWQTFAAVPTDRFSELAREISRKIVADELVHPSVRGLFNEPPQSLAEVAGRYGKLFAEVNEEWRSALVFARLNDYPTPTALADSDRELLRQVLYGPDSPCEPPDEPIVTTELYFTTKECEELWRLQGDVDRWLIQNAATPPYAVALQDRAQPVNARVLRRGNPAQLGEEVPRQFLEVLSSPDRRPFQIGSGRLELARAIIAPQNPLTARVIVNRVWQHHFGMGLVRTPSDFGLRAEPPSHPDLLDWLASRFIEESWSLKWLHRQILLSATYRQVSRSLPSDRDTAASDPSNRLLSRMTPRRLAWEELRDSLLTASGELHDTLGGRPFDLFAKNAAPRRTLYGLVDRQFLPGTLRMFDFANPDLHIPQRSETSVPQQALFLLNHPLVIDLAEALAEVSRSLPSDRDTGALIASSEKVSGTLESVPDTERIGWLFQRVFQRDPTPTEIAAAVNLLQSAASELQSKPPPPTAWSYGFGAFNEPSERVAGFTPLPYFTGKAWQGGSNWPDGKLGWVQLTAEGGHAGNDRQHAAIRRWTAPHAARVQVRSILVHDKSAGDGIRGFLVSSRQGLLHSATLHNAKGEFHVAVVDVQPGDTLDFVVDICDGLNNDDFTWEATIGEIATNAGGGNGWNSRTDFAGAPTRQLSPWAQLAQVLLLSNEFFYVD